jgi:hypothetical protein
MSAGKGVAPTVDDPRNRLWLVFYVLLVAAALSGFGLFIANLPSWYWHPLGSYAAQIATGRGYQFWSGVGSDLGELTLVTGLLVVIAGLWHHHCCEVQGCYRLQWKKTAAGDVVCKTHHPEDPKTAAQVMQDHHAQIRRDRNESLGG